MTDQELSAIEARNDRKLTGLTNHRGFMTTLSSKHGECDYEAVIGRLYQCEYEDIPALLAEVKRQAAEIAAATSERDEAVEIGDALCEEVENCYGRETALTQRWHERSGANG